MNLKTRRVNDPYFVGNWKSEIEPVPVPPKRPFHGERKRRAVTAFSFASRSWLLTEWGHGATLSVRVQGNATESVPLTLPSGAWSLVAVESSRRLPLTGRIGRTRCGTRYSRLGKAWNVVLWLFDDGLPDASGPGFCRSLAHCDRLRRGMAATCWDGLRNRRLQVRVLPGVLTYNKQEGVGPPQQAVDPSGVATHGEPRFKQVATKSFSSRRGNRSNWPTKRPCRTPHAPREAGATQPHAENEDYSIYLPHRRRLQLLQIRIEPHGHHAPCPRLGPRLSRPWRAIEREVPDDGKVLALVQVSHQHQVVADALGRDLFKRPKGPYLASRSLVRATRSFRASACFRSCVPANRSAKAPWD